MKLTAIALLCLSLLLAHIHFSLAKPKIKLFKKIPKIIPKKPKQTQDFNQGSYPKQPARPGSYPNQGSNPQQPGYPAGGSYPNQGSYPQQPARPGSYPNQGSYPQQPGYPAGGYPNQGGYPQQPARPGGYPYQGNYPQQPGYPAGGYPAGGYPAQGYPYGGGHGGHGGYGSYGGYGGYPGGYMNYNPNNKIPSPHYGGSFGYGGHGVGGGSPFSHSVQAMGVYPSDKSRGFGRTAVMAAAGGAVAGMALGYGLGRFPRPHFDFNSPQEEYYYNNYMYRKYGSKSTDTNDYSRDYAYSKPPESYDNFMDSCVKRKDLLPVENRQPNNKQDATTTTTTTTTTRTTTNATVTTTTTAAPETGTSNNLKSNSTAANTTSTSASSALSPLNQTGANPVPSASQVLKKTSTDDDDDDDTVSIVEIGYPALIKQLKVRRCVELYMVYSEKYLKKKAEPSPNDGVQGLEMGSRGLLVVVTSTILMLMNSNMLMLLR